MINQDMQTKKESNWIWDEKEKDYYSTQWDEETEQLHITWEKPRAGVFDERHNDEHIRNQTEGFTVVRAGLPYYRPTRLEEEAIQSLFRSKKTAICPNPSTLPATGDRFYQPLSDAYQMRVLRLHSGRFEDALHATLLTCSIELEDPAPPAGLHFSCGPARYAISLDDGQPVYYTAVSYAWGVPIFDDHVRCGNHTLPITKDLGKALRHLRLPDDDIILWIDQICINQSDLQEKSEQVILMGRIYRRAYTTIIWLGEQKDNSDHVFEIIRSIVSGMGLFADEGRPDVDEFERLSLPAPESQQWTELRSFLNRSWFTRTWIIQETVLSEALYVLCGKKSMLWSLLSTFADIIRRHDLIRFVEGSRKVSETRSSLACRNIKSIDGFKYLNKDSTGRRSLMELLVDSRQAEASLRKDKVYALMGLSYTTIEPDYSPATTPQDVYLQVTHALFPDEIMRLLYCVDHEQTPSESPSWVPDWGTPRITDPIASHSTFSGVYNACLRAKERVKLGKDGKSLHAVGRIWDTILETGVCYRSPDLEDLLLHGSETMTTLLDDIRLAMKCYPYPTGSGLFDAFWRTLIIGKNGTGREDAPADFAPVFSLLLDIVAGISPCFPDQTYPGRRLVLENLHSRRPARIYRQMQVAFAAAVRNRRMAITQNGYMGLVPRGSQPGDRLCVLLGGHVPLVLRGHPRGGYQLVGECYIHGVMKGEVMNMMGIEETEIELI